MTFITPQLAGGNGPFDESKLIEEQRFSLNDGRPVIAQLWAESGYTFLTYFFSDLAIENHIASDLIEYLTSNGIGGMDDFRQHIDTFVDDNGNSCWRVTLTIGESEE